MHISVCLKTVDQYDLYILTCCLAVLFKGGASFSLDWLGICYIAQLVLTLPSSFCCCFVCVCVCVCVFLYLGEFVGVCVRALLCVCVCVCET